MSYPVNAPPAYAGPSSPKKKHNPIAEYEPLLGAQAGTSTAGAVYDQPEETDLPDDFKYGTNVATSSPEIRRAFIRKVYSILFCQLLLTTLVGGTMYQNAAAVDWVQQNPWWFLGIMFGTMVNLGILFWKRHSYPINIILLTSFTVLEAGTVGVAISFYRVEIVLQALILTLVVFAGLTLFTMQSKWDFSGMGPWLFGGLMIMVAGGFVSFLFPMSKNVDLAYAIGGCTLFSGYIIFDTYVITEKFSPDEWIMATVALYLDLLNLFLSILRLLNNIEDR
jgi:FtsH-binding integral membrane protein